MKKLFIFVCLLSSCATYVKPVQKEITKSFTVNKDFDSTWTSVVKVFAEKNITFKTIDKTSGLIATDEKTFGPFENGGLIDCGTMKGTNLAQTKGLAIYNVFLEKDSDKSTKVTVNVKAKMVSLVQVGYQSQTAEVECYSTGVFEKDFYNQIK